MIIEHQKDERLAIQEIINDYPETKRIVNLENTLDLADTSQLSSYVEHQSPQEGTRAKSTNISCRQSMAIGSRMKRAASRDNKYAANLRTNLNKITKKMQDNTLMNSQSNEQLE